MKIIVFFLMYLICLLIPQRALPWHPVQSYGGGSRSQDKIWVQAGDPETEQADHSGRAPAG